MEAKGETRRGESSALVACAQFSVLRPQGKAF